MVFKTKKKGWDANSSFNSFKYKQLKVQISDIYKWIIVFFCFQA
jgi:hypothetical protein